MSAEHHNRHDHERSDWNLKWVLWSFALLVISVAIMITASWWIFKTFHFAAASRQLGTVRGVENLPPEPRLQVSPDRDWIDMRNQEQQALTSYGWIDRPHGVVRIPIQEAMERIAQQGLPHTEGGGPQK
jgi:hypothetical protein